MKFGTSTNSVWGSLYSSFHTGTDYRMSSVNLYESLPFELHGESFEFRYKTDPQKDVVNFPVGYVLEELGEKNNLLAHTKDGSWENSSNLLFHRISFDISLKLKNESSSLENLIDCICRENLSLLKLIAQENLNREEVVNLLEVILNYLNEYSLDFIENIDDYYQKIIGNHEWFGSTKIDFIECVLRHYGESYIEYSDDLVKVFKSLDNSPLSRANKRRIATHVIKTCQPEQLKYLEKGMKHFFQIVSKRTDWSPKELASLINHILLRSQPTSYEVFSNINYILDACESLNINKKRRFITYIMRCCKNYSSVAFYKIKEMSDLLSWTDWSESQKYKLIRSIIYFAPKNFRLASSFAIRSLDQVESRDADEFIRLYRSFLKSMNHHNQEQILELLYEKSRDYFISSVYDDAQANEVLKHMKFFLQICKVWPRSSFSIMEGIFAAAHQGLIQGSIISHQKEIFQFVYMTKNFSPALFEEYLKSSDKESFLKNIQCEIQKIIKDEFDLEDIDRIVEQYSWKYLLGLVQMVCPVSGTSHTKREDMLKLFQRMTITGNHRDHLPQIWKTIQAELDINIGERRIRDGQKKDPFNVVGEITSVFENSDIGVYVGLFEIKDAICNYLAVPYENTAQKDEAREYLVDLLFQYLAQDDLILESFFLVRDNPYKLLVYLEHMLTNDHYIPELLRKAFLYVPKSVLENSQRNRNVLEDNPKKLIRTINNIVLSRMPDEKKYEVLMTILDVVERKSLKDKVLNDPRLSINAHDFIERILQDKGVLSYYQLKNEVLSKLFLYIKDEQRKYSFEEHGSKRILLKPVKSVAFCLNGITSGICSDKDIQLWKDPNFKLIGIFDKNEDTALGFVYCYDVEINGKKYLTLPGINPTEDFLASVDAYEFYSLMIKQIVSFAKAAGYSGVYIPTDNNLSSNHGDIKRAIKRNKYRIKKIPEVHWNHLPEPYPFSEVFEIWVATEENPILPD